MKKTASWPLLFCMTIVVLLPFAGFAKAQTEWSDITDPAEVRKLVSGKAIDGKYFTQYFRHDGNAVVDFGGPTYPALSVRKWTIKNDGKLCIAPFAKPDRIADCYSFQRTSGNSPKYRFRARMGLLNFEVMDTVPAKLSKAVSDTARASQ